MRFVAIDLGASFVKSALVDPDRLTIEPAGRVPFPPFVPGRPAGYREVSTEALLEIAKDAIDRLLALAPDCAGIVCCGQMHGLVLTDLTGAPLTPGISWMDERTLPDLEALTSAIEKSGGADMIPGITAGSTAALLFRLSKEGKLPEGAVPSSLPNFVMARLSKTQPACDPTMASGFGLFDVLRGDWHRPAIEALGLSRLRWPAIVRYDRPVGRYRSPTGPVPVYSAWGDQPCALLGAGLKPLELSVNVSTGSQVSCLSDRFEPGDYEVRSYFGGLFLNTVTHLPAGRALSEQVALARKSWDLLEQEAQGGRSQQGRLFLTALERMAEDYHAAARRIDPSGRCRALVFSGGLLVRSPLLQRLIQARFGLPCRTAPTREETLWGLSFRARTLCGRAATLLQAMETAESPLSPAIG